MPNFYPSWYEQYNTQYPRRESIYKMWWDTNTYVSGTTLRLPFFNAVRATPDLSNMEVASMFASPKAFLLRAIRFYPKQRPESTTAQADNNIQTGALDDMVQLLNTGVFTLTIGDKVYCEFPLWALPSGAGAKPFFQTGDADVVIDYATNGMPSPDAVYTLSKPLFIAPQINFQVEINWAAALTLALEDTALTLVLEGDEIRPVQ